MEVYLPTLLEVQGGSWVVFVFRNTDESTGFSLHVSNSRNDEMRKIGVNNK